MSSKYIVRQPIKDSEGKILGHEILYHGENQAFTVENPQAREFASADTIYSFLTQNSTTTLRGSLNFMTFRCPCTLSTSLQKRAIRWR